VGGETRSGSWIFVHECKWQTLQRMYHFAWEMCNSGEVPMYIKHINISIVFLWCPEHNWNTNLLICKLIFYLFHQFRPQLIPLNTRKENANSRWHTYFSYALNVVFCLHHCDIIFFWSSMIMNCMLFIFENKSSAHALGGVSGVASFINIDKKLQLKDH